MSAEEILAKLMPELSAIADGQCIWCRRQETHPEYSRCPHQQHYAKTQKIPDNLAGMHVSLNG